MAGDWIKFETATPDKPEVWQIAEAAGIDPDAVVGKLLRIWIWFDQHTENGNAPSVTKLILDRFVGVTGFCDLVILAGWMTEKSGRITLPNFDRHNGKTAKNRALTAKRVADYKANAKVTLDALPREEKRREEIEEKKQAKKETAADARKRAVFVKPTTTEVAAYCTERGNNVDAVAFCDYYESVNWHVGKKRMSDWRAAVRTWEKRNAENQRSNRGGNNGRSKSERFLDAVREFAAGDMGSGTVREDDGEVWPQVVEFLPGRNHKSGNG